MKNEVKRWIVLQDLLENHKRKYRNKITYPGACKLLFKTLDSNNYTETAEESLKLKRQTFRWSK